MNANGGDPTFGTIREITEVPDILVGRLSHDLAADKLRPDTAGSVSVGEAYGPAHAETVVVVSREDYRVEFGESSAC